MAKLVVGRSTVFRDVVEMEKTTLSPRSRRLFTLSAIYHATAALLDDLEVATPEEKAELATAFWEEIGRHMREWELVRKSRITAGEVREDFIHSHGVVLQALGRVGNCLLLRDRGSWQTKLAGLDSIDWRRSNAAMWEGRAMIGGRVSKAAHNVVLTTNAIKRHLGLPLTPEEQRIEDAFKRGEYAPEQRPAPQVVGLRRARLQADDRTPPRRSGGTL